MMNDYDLILMPAIKRVITNPKLYANQPDLTSFPDIAIAKDFGKDHIWKGPIFYLMNKDKFAFSGQANVEAGK
jgi:hypothetical protein